MTTITLENKISSAAIQNQALATTRDPRLDFFRGIAMYIILMAHIPGNVWSNWIPARFGFSDATEIFVFCSGVASAIAFGGAFARLGWFMGAARVIYRIWQVYWAHIGLFFFIAMMMAAADYYGSFDKSYVASLNLQHFFDDPMPQIVGLFTLTYVPNYFDILPMYLGILALMPLMVALARFNPLAAVGVSLLLWIAANAGWLSLPAEPWSNRPWFFNPFGWQLLFFTGFAFRSGWLPMPPVRSRLMWAAAAFLVLSAPFGSWKVLLWVDAIIPPLGDLIHAVWSGFSRLEDAIGFHLRQKTDFGVFRYIHFLSLGYLAWALAGDDGWRLRAMASGAIGPIGQQIFAWTTKVGQQSLAVFVFSMAFARPIGMALDQVGRGYANVAIANVFGMLVITGVAFIAGWFKSHPWRRKES